MKFSYILLFLVTLLVIATNVFAQYQVEGMVQIVGLNPEPVSNALVELISQDDTTQVTSTTTDIKGRYILQVTTTGRILYRVTGTRRCKHDFYI